MKSLSLIFVYFLSFGLFVIGACANDWIIENSGDEYELRQPWKYPRKDRPNLFYGRREFSCCTRLWNDNVYDDSSLDGIPTSVRFCLFFICGIPIFGIAIGKGANFYKLEDAVSVRRLTDCLLTRS